MLGLGNGGVVVAEQWVPSGLAAVIVASNPFWMAAVESVLPDGERLRANIISGLVVGFSGIVVLVWPDLAMNGTHHPGFLAGVVALQVASIGWSLGSAYSRRHARADHVLGTTACQMLAGGVFMTAAGTLRGEWAHLSFTNQTFWWLVYLSSVGAIGGFVAYTYALRHLPVSFVSLYAFQSDHRGGARRPHSSRIVRFANGRRCRPRVLRRRDRTMERPPDHVGRTPGSAGRAVHLNEWTVIRQVGIFSPQR